MDFFLNALRALWAVFKAQGASKAASELPQGAAQVKAVSDDLAEISAELVRGPVVPPSVPTLPAPAAPPPK